MIKSQLLIPFHCVSMGKLRFVSECLCKHTFPSSTRAHLAMGKLRFVSECLCKHTFPSSTRYQWVRMVQSPRSPTTIHILKLFVGLRFFMQKKGDKILSPFKFNNNNNYKACSLFVPLHSSLIFRKYF